MKVLNIINLVVAILAGLATIATFITAAIVVDPHVRPFYIDVGIGLGIGAVLAIGIWFLVRWRMSIRARQAQEGVVTDDTELFKKMANNAYRIWEEQHGGKPSGQNREQPNSD